MEAPAPDPVSLREQGSASFKAGQFLKAAALYTKAIQEDPTSAVLHSNLSAALLKLKKVAKALAAADECIRLDPQYEKGYFRRGAVLESTDPKSPEALVAYFQAWQLNKGNAEICSKVQTLCRKIKSSGIKVPDEVAAAAPELAAAAAAASAASAAAAPAAATKPAGSSSSGEGGSGSSVPSAAAVGPPPPQAPLSSAAAMPGVKLSGSAAPLLAELAATPGGRLASEFLSMAMEIVGDSYANFVPSVHFLPGPSPQPGMAEEQTHIRAEAAFETPDTLAGFTDYLRTQATALDATAIVGLVPRHAVAYPQVWSKPGWPHGAAAGIFVQLESAELRRVWFVMAQPGSSTGSLSELPYDTFALLPKLLRKA